MRKHFPRLKEWNKLIYRRVTADMLVAPGWSVSWLPHAGCPGAALCFYWSVGSSPCSLGTTSAPSSSVCGYAPPCWAQSITQRSHCNCDLRWQLMLCANQTSWAAKAHRVNDWMLYAGSRHTGDKFLLRPIIAGRVQRNNNVSSYLPTVWLASCLIRLNCFFILCFSALPPGGRVTPHISLIEWSQISALIYGRRRGSVFKHPVCGNIELNPPHFCWWGLCVSVIRSAPLLQRCWTDFSLSLPPSLTARWRDDVPRRCTMGNVVHLDLLTQERNFSL